MAYIFSFYRKETRVRLKKRAWWNLFGSDSLEPYEAWQRYMIDINEFEADLLQQYDRSGELPTSIYMKLISIGKPIDYVQLEVDHGMTDLLPTSSTDHLHDVINPGDTEPDKDQDPYGQN